MDCRVHFRCLFFKTRWHHGHGALAATHDYEGISTALWVQKVVVVPARRHVDLTHQHIELCSLDRTRNK